MLVPIAIQAYKRPHYLKQTLDTLKKSTSFALKQNSSLDFRLVASLEPGYDETVDIIRSVDFMDTTIYVNTQRLGMNMNVFISIDRALQFGDVVINTDEDCDYSEDFLWFCVCMLDRYKNDDDILHITPHFTNFWDIRLDKTYKKYGAYICGTITWIDRWNWFRDNWFTNKALSYDANLTRAFPKNKAGVGPIVGRSRHNGKYDGTCSSPQMWEGPQILWAGDFPPQTDWHEDTWTDGCWTPK